MAARHHTGGRRIREDYPTRASASGATTSRGKGTLVETAMDMELKRAEQPRQRLGAVEYLAMADMCDRHANRVRKFSAKADTSWNPFA